MKFHKKNPQNAQGMVEFALVLPVLLLLIFGIIAFGHMMFSYSFTIAASREAARWGAAVGVTENGLPRFRDCDEMLETAVRVGAVAGVRPESVVIEYDHGPDSLAPYAACPPGGQGPDVNLSDRVIVTIVVNYQPIVPLVNIQPFPIRAETARTIIRSLPVGEAPPLAPTCISTYFEIDSTSLPLDVGQTETFTYAVKSSETEQPTSGTVTIQIAGVNKLVNSPALAGSFTHIFITHGEVVLKASFDSSDPMFCSIDPPESRTFKVRRESVTTIIEDSPDPSAPDQRIDIKVKVTPKVGVSPIPPSGVVLVYDKEIVGIGCLVSLDAKGEGSCPLLGYPALGVRRLVAIYQGDMEFTPSPESKAEEHTVVGVIPPTIIPSPTEELPPTPMPICPVLVTTFNFKDQNDGFWISIRNPDITPVKLKLLDVTWPAKPGGDASLKEIRFDTTTTTACSGASPACIWVANPDPVGPTNKIFGTGPDQIKWSGPANLNLPAGATKQIRFVFTTELPDTKNNGTMYAMTIEFDKAINGTPCKIVIPDTIRNLK